MEPPSRIDELIQWFGRNGGYINEAVQLLHGTEYGYHYVSRGRPIASRETVCKCPFNLTISYLNVEQTKSPTTDRPHFVESVCSKLLGIPQIEKRTVGIFLITEERLKGQDSFWHPYIQLLPDTNEMHTPLLKDEEVAYLKGTNLFPNDTSREETPIGRQEASLKAQWRLGVDELKGAGNCIDGFTWELFLWGATVFSSRGFTSNLLLKSNGTAGDSFPILYPVLDIFNHRPGEKVGWQFCKGDFSLFLEEGVEQGEQLFNNYSPKGNEDLLMGFGFCIPDNPYDQVTVQLSRSLPPGALRRLHESMPLHWRSETGKPGEFLFHLRRVSCGGSDAPSICGNPTLNSLRSTPPELVRSVYIILCETYKASGGPKEAVSEEQIWNMTIDILLNQTESALMNITRWDGGLPDTPPTAGAKAALIYRKGQVKILEEAIAEIKGLTMINYDASCSIAEMDQEVALNTKCG